MGLGLQHTPLPTVYRCNTGRLIQQHATLLHTNPTHHRQGRGMAWHNPLEGTEHVLLQSPSDPLAHQSMGLVLLRGLQHDGCAAEAAMDHPPLVQHQDGRCNLLCRAQDGPHVAWTVVRDGLLQELAPLSSLLQQQCDLGSALGSAVKGMRGGIAAMSPCALHQQQCCLPAEGAPTSLRARFGRPPASEGTRDSSALAPMSSIRASAWCAHIGEMGKFMGG